MSTIIPHCGNLTIFPQLRFYVKSNIVQKIPSKIFEIHLITPWNLISRKFLAAEKLSNVYTVTRSLLRIKEAFLFLASSLVCATFNTSSWKRGVGL